MNSPSNVNSFLLPKLKGDTDLRLQDSGEWTVLPLETFQKVAASLDVKPPAPGTQHISSIPDMWARALSMEMALFTEEYPIRAQMVEQWRGMLGAIAFAEIKDFNLKVHRLNLKRETLDDFSKSLVALPPSQLNVLYTIEDSNAWFDLFVFLWNGKPVGMTSPSTLVCPSEEGAWEGLPWWKDGHLQSPIKSLNQEEKDQLQVWLEHLCRVINDPQAIYRGKPNARNTVLGHLQDFQRDLATDSNALTELSNRSPQAIKAYLNRSDTFFGSALDLGALRALSNPLASTRSPSDIFLSELFFIEYEEGILSGSFLPPGSDALTLDGRKIFPLMPLNPSLLNELNTHDLLKETNIRFEQRQTSSELFIRVSLTVPAGTDDSGKQGEAYPVFRDYSLLPENSITELPVLDMWPYFEAADWQEYYAFYFGRDDDRTFQISFPGAEEHTFKEVSGNFKTSKFSKFPTFAVCEMAEKPIGILLFEAPPKIEQAGGARWIVGVDFGTSFTNVYVNNNGLIDRLELSSLHLPAMGNAEERRSLFEYFIPENFIPADDPLPLASVLTTRRNQNTLDLSARAIFDGRIYIPQDSSSFIPVNEWIRTDLKWSEARVFSGLFLRHLALHIAALAKKQGVKNIDWRLSFPKAFSENDKRRYIDTWSNISQALQAKTGIEFVYPDGKDNQSFCSESVAIARYFRYREQSDLVRTTCIDIGGGTSDISIWQKNELVHQCSVRLAGQHLFSQFIELNPGFLGRQLKLDSSDLNNWQGLRETKFSTKLDVWLRQYSNSWLRSERDLAASSPEFRELLQLMTLGFAGLYYYVGLLLRALATEASPKYTESSVTAVYLGGNGSRFLNWLCAGSRFDTSSDIGRLLNQLTSRAASFKLQIPRETRISSQLKGEVACGLVTEGTALRDPQTGENDYLIAGERFELNGEIHEWRSHLPTSGSAVKELRIHELHNLHSFLDEFHIALQEVGVEEITGIPGYEPNQAFDEGDRLWYDTRTELENLILDMQNAGSEAGDIRVEPPFILGLKALLKVLGRRWADRWK